MAGFIRRVLSHLGIFKEDGNGKQRTGRCDAGLSGSRAVRVKNKAWNAPVISQCTPGAGGVQGLRWYTEKLQMDEDGDVAQEFLDEVVLHASCSDELRRPPRLEVKMLTRPVKPKGPLCTSNGNVHQFVESSSGIRGGDFIDAT